MNAETRYDQMFQAERSIEAFIPYSNHITNKDLVTKEGDLVRTYSVKGISFETSSFDELTKRKNRLNILLRGIGDPHVALWVHHVRRKKSDKLYSHFDNKFSRAFDQKYFDSFDGYRMLVNELYVTVVYRPTITSGGKALGKVGRRGIQELHDEQLKNLEYLEDTCKQIESSLQEYGIRCLEMTAEFMPNDPMADDNGNVLFSETLTFMNFLLSGRWQKVRVPKILLSDYLGGSQIRMGTSTIEINDGIGLRYAKVVDFKEYASQTSAGVMDEMMYSNFEYVMTQSFSFMMKRSSLEFLKKQKGQLINTNDGSTSQIMDMDEAIDGLTDGEFNMGEYHFTLAVFADTIEDVQEHVTKVNTTLGNMGFIPALVTLATDAAYFAQLPCNWAYRPRIAKLTSGNFAGMTALHNFVSGKRDGNPWGDAVTILKTPSGQPLYFNFHDSDVSKNEYGKKLLGNTIVIGRSGTGKTVLLNALLTQAQKYAHKSEFGFTTVFFDKDEGAKVAVNALNGKYLSIKNGKPTGFNPFQIENNPGNVVFLNKLIKWMVTQDGNTITTNDETKIEVAINTVLNFPKEMRSLSVLIQNMTENTVDMQARENSIIKRLLKWCANDGNNKRGKYAWVFDNPVDELDFSSNTNFGIDGTDFLDNEDISTPLTMYLLHRMDEVIDGRRFIYVMDELWKWLATNGESNGAEFSEFVGDKQLTIRKKDGFGVFASQMPSSLLKSKVANELIQQSATKIFLPNPDAIFDEYVEGFGLTETEFSVVRDLGVDSRLMLIKQGHNSVIAGLDLGGGHFDDELLILSGSEDTNQIYDEVIEEMGDVDSTVWIPEYIKRCKYKIMNEKRAKVG